VRATLSGHGEPSHLIGEIAAGDRSVRLD
jgi:hypothetical protein